MAVLAARAAAAACLLLALAASAAGAGSHSHAPAPAPAAVDCTTVALGLADCVSYVTPGSTDKSPSKTCCGEVKTTVASPFAVDCLCSLASSKNLPIPIDMKRVFALPAACGASNAVFSKCHISAGSPGEAPASSPAGGSPSGGATASPPHAAASSQMTATALVAAVAAPLLAYCYLF